MNLENIMLVKKATHKRPHIAWLHSQERSRIDKSTCKEDYTGSERGIESNCLVGTECPSEVMKIF